MRNVEAFNAELKQAGASVFAAGLHPAESAAGRSEGHGIVRHLLQRNRPGPYQIQAAINAVDGDAAVAADTDWRQIVQLYDQLLARWPSPIVALHRAVAVAEVDGSAAALPLVDALPIAGPRGLGEHRPFHAIRASLLARLGRRGEAVAAYDAALACPGNDAERAGLARDRDVLLDG